MVLRAAERLHALPVRRAVRVDVARDRGRTHEAHRPDVGVLEDPVHRDLVALDDVEHAVGQPGVREQLREHERRARVLLGGLEDEGVAAGHRVRAHPDRDHRGEVERRDARDHAQRLTDLEHVDAGGHLLGEAALQQVRDRRRVLDVLEPALHLAHRVREHLAVLRREDGRDVGLAGLEQLADPEHDLGPLGQRRRAPGRERLLGGLDRLVQLGGVGEVHLVRLLAGGGVVHGPSPSRLAGHVLAADVVADALHGGSFRDDRGERLDRWYPFEDRRRPASIGP